MPDVMQADHTSQPLARCFTQLNYVSLNLASFSPVSYLKTKQKTVFSNFLRQSRPEYWLMPDPTNTIRAFVIKSQLVR